MIKSCSKCTADKPISEFYSDKRAKDKKHSWCKQCFNDAKRKKMADDSEYKEKVYQKSREWYRQNCEGNKAYNKKYKRENLGKVLFLSARYRAQKTGLEFNIEVDDIKVPTHCPILGILLEKGNIKDKDSSPSLDRVDNSKGYVKGNIKVISTLANQMKSKASISQIKTFTANIEAYLEN